MFSHTFSGHVITYLDLFHKQYIQNNMYMILLYFISRCYHITSYLWIYLINSHILYSIVSLPLRSSYVCPRASEVTLKDMAELDHNLTTTKHKKLQNIHNSWAVLNTYFFLRSGALPSANNNSSLKHETQIYVFNSLRSDDAYMQQ